MALSKIQPASMDLTANYAFTGTNSIAGVEYEEKKLATVTASSSATLSFTSDIDSTYNIYKFRFVDIHGSSNNRQFRFQASTDGGSNYNTTVTSNSFKAFHYENDSSTSVEYDTGRDLAQATSFQPLTDGVGSGDDESCAGELFLFDPSSTTFAKHFISTIQLYHADDRANPQYTAGYFNTTSAINAIQFKFDTGNIDSGTIEMYGIN
jgi:hypothetical protein